jgi:hypothetical protein
MGLIYRRDRLLGQGFQVLPELRQLIWAESVNGLVDFCSCRNGYALWSPLVLLTSQLYLHHTDNAMDCQANLLCPVVQYSNTYEREQYKRVA